MYFSTSERQEPNSNIDRIADYGTYTFSFISYLDPGTSVVDVGPWYFVERRYSSSSRGGGDSSEYP